MQKRRNSQVLNLAFLDVMSCGLGAVILIFMLVKFNAKPPQPGDEIPRLETELQLLSRQKSDIELSIQYATNKTDEEASALEQLRRNIQRLRHQAENAAKALRDKANKLDTLEKSVVVAAPNKADDVIELEGQGEENYLLGLNVKGSNIGILLDNSASMSDVKLVEIIRRKISSDTEKRAAPKWNRTRRVARWLLARVPKTSKLSVVSFNKQAQLLGSNKIITPADKKGMQQISQAIDKLIPEEGTNLQSALEKIKALNPNLSHLYLITDGLPTLGEKGGGLETFGKCGSFFGSSTTISGQCREILFYNSVKKSAPQGVEVNVILLPLEGDPSAPKAYWDWTSSTGGLLLSPADSWP